MNIIVWENDYFIRLVLKFDNRRYRSEKGQKMGAVSGKIDAVNF